MNEARAAAVTVPEVDPAAVHALAAGEVAERLGVDPDAGLTAAEARARLDRHGRNELADTSAVRWTALVARQFADVLIGILLAAAAVAALVGEVTDAVAILAIVVLNAALGFAQEWKAERALASLRRMLVPRCTVVRDGTRQEVDAATLVPGDVVVLGAGTRIPADLRLVEALDLHCDEASLTGESVPVPKSVEPVARDADVSGRASMAWMGTNTTHGWGRGVVTATGMATQFGRIAELTAGVDHDRTPLQARLATLGRQLGIAALAIAALVVVVGMLTGRPPLQMFLTGVALAVAVVPEGLPAVVTITLALGLRAMARRRALVRRLRSAETLGAASVILTDKTGTLTKNEMTVTHVWLPALEVRVSGVGYEPAGDFEGPDGPAAGRDDLRALLETGAICNHAELVERDGRWTAQGSPTEAALVVAARKAGIDGTGPRRRGEFSFDSDRKRMTVIAEGPDGLLAHVKGAPEVLLERCTRVRDGDRERPLDDDDRAAVAEAVERLAHDGLRVLALARRDVEPGAKDAGEVERDLVLLGLVGMIDPARPEIPEAVALARSAGIRVILVTGDAPGTAAAVARSVGLDAERVRTGKDLARLDREALAREVGSPGVCFARTAPEQKMRLVEVLQEAGHVVAMTGDGVNDAPALKRADVGIAMGERGTDVAKGAADVVLTDDNFATIVSAVEEGRRQYDNLTKFVAYLLSSNVAEIVAITANLAFDGPLLLLPAQILWINLVTDSVSAVALGLEPAERDLMRRPPERQPILDRRGIGLVLGLGTYMGVVALALYRTQDPARAQTMAFHALVIAELVNVFNFRSRRSPLASIGFLSNPWLLVAWLAVLGLQCAALYVPALADLLRVVPLGLEDWGLVVLACLPTFLVLETWKWARSRR